MQKEELKQIETTVLLEIHKLLEDYLKKLKEQKDKVGE